MLKNILNKNLLNLFFNFRSTRSFRLERDDSLLGYLRNDSLYDSFENPDDCCFDEFNNGTVDNPGVGEARVGPISHTECIPCTKKH